MTVTFMVPVVLLPVALLTKTCKKPMIVTGIAPIEPVVSAVAVLS
jgi:hypothetical protein